MVAGFWMWKRHFWKRKDDWRKFQIRHHLSLLLVFNLNIAEIHPLKLA